MNVKQNAKIWVNVVTILRIVVLKKCVKLKKEECKKMGKFLKCLMVCECLCSYISTCCCEHEEVSSSCLSELCSKCDKLMGCCKELEACLSKDMCSYLNCETLMKYCQSCKGMKHGSKKSKKKK
jgi:hypothetical protein